MKRTAVILTVLILTATVGCRSPDERLMDQLAESQRQQAQQNIQQSKVGETVADGSRRLVEAVADSRHEIQRMEQDLQEQRTRLEDERKAIAKERKREAFWEQVVSVAGLVIICGLPLVIAAGLLAGISREKGGSSMEELAIEQLVRNLDETPRIEMESHPAAD